MVRAHDHSSYSQIRGKAANIVHMTRLILSVSEFVCSPKTVIGCASFGKASYLA